MADRPKNTGTWVVNTIIVKSVYRVTRQCHWFVFVIVDVMPVLFNCLPMFPVVLFVKWNIFFKFLGRVAYAEKRVVIY